MPTIKPRIAVTLDQNTYEVVARLAELQSRSKGAVVGDLLDAAVQPMRRTVALLEAAASAPESLKQGLRSVFESVHDDLAAAAGGYNQQLDSMLQELQSVGSSRGSTPVPVTRGSGHDSEAPKNASKPTKKRSTKRV